MTCTLYRVHYALQYCSSSDGTLNTRSNSLLSFSRGYPPPPASPSSCTLDPKQCNLVYLIGLCSGPPAPTHHTTPHNTTPPTLYLAANRPTSVPLPLNLDKSLTGPILIFKFQVSAGVKINFCCKNTLD